MLCVLAGGEKINVCNSAWGCGRRCTLLFCAIAKLRCRGRKKEEEKLNITVGLCAVALVETLNIALT
jgi:hypothetical protein